MININENLEKCLLGYSHEVAHFYAYFVIGFLVPFMVGHPQLLVGIMVNAVLILGALEMRSPRYMLPLLFAPSLGVLARGLIFGPMTPFLAIMIPFIWVANALLVYGIRETYKKRDVNYGISLAVSSVVKSLFLFSTAFVLVSMAILPEMFLVTMGTTQLLTAVGGGMLAFGVHKSGATRVLGREITPEE
jgi:hypothetical protein